MEVGVPCDFFGEDHFAVDHGSGFAVGTAQVEPDPAAVQVSAQGLSGGFCGGSIFVRGVADFHGVAVNVAHHFGVELAFAVLQVVDRLHGIGNALIAGDGHFVAAIDPEHGLDETFHVAQVRLEFTFVCVAEKDRFIDACALIVPFHHDLHVHGLAGSLHGCLKSAVPEYCRHKVGVKTRHNARFCIFCDFCHHGLFLLMTVVLC